MTELKIHPVLERIRHFFEKYAVYVLAFIVGALIISPTLYFHYFDKQYRGIEFFGNSDEVTYLAQIQEVYDGHYAFGNLYFADLKNAPPVQQSLSPFLVMIFGRVIGVNAVTVNIITKFILPFLLTLLVFVFFKTLTRRRDLAFVMTAFFMLGPATLIWLNPGAWLPFFKFGSFVGTDMQFLSYGRPINPQVSSFFFFGYLICLWKLLYQERQRWFGWLSVVILGLSFYTYFFCFSLLFGISGLLALWFLCKKELVQFKKILLVISGGLLIGIPYFISVITAMHSPWYSELTGRFGVAVGRTFLFSRVWWGTTILILLLYRRWDDFKIFILAFLGATFIFSNEQLFTARSIPIPSHYHWYYIAPIGGAVLFYLLFLQLLKLPQRWIFRSLFVVFVVLLLWSGVQFQIQSYRVQHNSFVAVQHYAPAILWFQKNLPADSTVLGNGVFNQLLPAYTNKNVYSNAGAGDFLVDEKRLEHNLLVYMRLSGITTTTVTSYLVSNRNQVGAWLYSQTYRVQNGCYGCFPDSKISALAIEYDDFLKHDFVAELKKLPLDYIVWDKTTDPTWEIDKYFKKVVFSSGDISIYSAN